MRKTAFFLLFWFITGTAPVFAQEMIYHNGTTFMTSSDTSSYAWGATYLEGLGEHAAWSITYMNEGHVSNHKRDGLAPQLWGRVNVLGRRVSLAAGAGPYLYYDTVLSTTDTSYSNEHGVGAMASLSATLYMGARFLLQARGNWIWTKQNANTYVATLGIGYQLEKPPSPGPLTGASPQVDPKTLNEVTLQVGSSVFNERSDRSGAALLAEYRRTLWRHVDVTVGWLNEDYPASRQGPLSQIWAGRSFFNDHLSFGIGAGPYLAFDRSGDSTITKLNWVVGATGSLRFLSHWAIRATWNRVTTSNNRDSDIFVAGVGFRF
ncbi:MAG TPA: hypothetical protein VGJ94_17570 [Syntrophorhabdaceae bacterium]|jgi:hypothetical protein